MQHIASEFNLLEGPISKVHGEAFVRGAYCCYEVIFECSHGSFGCICLVHAGGCFLIGNGFFHHEVYEFFGAFIVQIVEQWASASHH